MTEWSPLVYTPGTPAPPIRTTAKYLPPSVTSGLQDIYDYPPVLRAMQTVIIYIDPNGNLFHLNGPQAGKEGVRLAETIQGEQHFPFTQVTIESAFQIGTTIQRTNIDARRINMRIMIGAANMNNFTYRMCEERFWAGQVETSPGWLGVFTRFSGWRWGRVWLAKTVDTSLRQDPVAYGNNFAIWDLYWMFEDPRYYKPTRWAKFDAYTALQPDRDGYWTGHLTVANCGDLETHVQYLVSGSGWVKVQDNNSTSMVSLPEIFASDGAVLVDSDPAAVPVVAENDPQDNTFYKFIRASGILNFLLSGVADGGEPVWKRQYVRFVYSIPPNSVTTLKVQHSNESGSITAFVRQPFRRSR